MASEQNSQRPSMPNDQPTSRRQLYITLFLHLETHFSLMYCNYLYTLVNVKIIKNIEIDAMIDTIKRIIIRQRLRS